MAAISELERPSISVAYVQILVELVADRGIEVARLLAGMPGIDALLARLDGRVSPLQLMALAARAIELTGDPALGYAYGLRLRPTSHGFLGYAVLSSASVREAAERVVHYVSARSSQLQVTLVEREDDAFLVAEARVKLPMPRLRQSLLEALALGTARNLAVLLGRELDELEGVELWFEAGEPDYHRAWAERLPAVRFETGMMAVRVPRAYLDASPVLADPFASMQALAQCERELAVLPVDEAHFVGRVRALLTNAPASGPPTLDEAAKALAVSSRTLKRRLLENGTTYLALVNDRREREARALLADATLPIARIASSLGYDPPNFTRAFARWTGMTPSEFRARAARSGLIG